VGISISKKKKKKKEKEKEKEKFKEDEKINGGREIQSWHRKSFFYLVEDFVLFRISCRHY